MKKERKKYFNLDLKKNIDGIKKIVTIKRFREKRPITDNTCKLSIDQEKLQTQRFHGNPVRTLLLKKSENAKAMLIKKTDDKFLSQ